MEGRHKGYTPVSTLHKRRHHSSPLDAAPGDRHSCKASCCRSNLKLQLCA